MLGQPQARDRNWLPQPPFVSVASSLCGSGKDKALKSDWREGQRTASESAQPQLPFQLILPQGGFCRGCCGSGLEKSTATQHCTPGFHWDTTDKQEAWLSLQQHTVSSDWDPRPPSSRHAKETDASVLGAPRKGSATQGTLDLSHVYIRPSLSPPPPPSPESHSSLARL